MRAETEERTEDGERRTEDGERAESYQLEFVKCGKERCKTCREGKGHGPYWYAYRKEGEKTKKRYIGRQLPKEPGDEQKAETRDPKVKRWHKKTKAKPSKRQRPYRIAQQVQTSKGKGYIVLITEEAGERAYRVQFHHDEDRYSYGVFREAELQATKEER